MRDSLARRFLSHRVLLWCTVVLLLLILWPGGFRLIFPSSDEVSFSAGLSSTSCSGFLANESIDSENCRASYRLTLGNTGSNPQERIEVTLHPVPQTWRLGVNVTDIVASAREKVSPGVDHRQLDDTLTFTISNLQPNRQVVLQLVTIGEESSELLATTAPVVNAEGILVETNTQLTVVARFFRSLFGLFGL